jgi:hypothetical protein
MISLILSLMDINRSMKRKYLNFSIIKQIKRFGKGKYQILLGNLKCKDKIFKKQKNNRENIKEGIKLAENQSL